MPALDRETVLVQNSALGAAILWRFCCAYDDASKATPCVLPLLYLVLPLVFHEETAEVAIGTRTETGLRGFVNKFTMTEMGKSDIVARLGERAIEMRGLKKDSLQLALQSHLLGLQPRTASVFPISKTAARTGFSTAIRRLFRAAEHFGGWIGEVSLYEVQTTLGIRL